MCFPLRREIRHFRVKHNFLLLVVQQHRVVPDDINAHRAKETDFRVNRLQLLLDIHEIHQQHRQLLPRNPGDVQRRQHALFRVRLFHAFGEFRDFDGVPL